MSKVFSTLSWTFVLIAPFFIGCAPVSDSLTSNAGNKPNDSSQLNAVAQFDSIRVGMPRTTVEGLLGVPTHSATESQNFTWYLPPPKIKSYQSPFSPGAIGIRFDEDQVLEKVLNPHARN